MLGYWLGGGGGALDVRLVVAVLVGIDADAPVLVGAEHEGAIRNYEAMLNIAAIRIWLTV